MQNSSVPIENPKSKIENPNAALVQWVLLSVLATTGLTITAVHAPNRIKLIGLFAVVYGLCAGYVVARLSQLIKRRKPWPMSAFAFLVIAAGQAGMTLESHRLYAAAVRERYRWEADWLAVDSLSLHGQDQPTKRQQAGDSRASKLPSKPPAVDLLIGPLREERAQKLAVQTSFSTFLEHRASALGLRGPWPAVVWGAELVLGSLAGAWLTYRLARSKLEGETSVSQGSARGGDRT